MKNWLIIYDIRDKKRLVKIAKEMENYGVRCQRSVFEVIGNSKLIEELRSKVQSLMAEEDFVVYFNICDKDWQQQEKYGLGKFEILDDEDFRIL